MFERVYNPTLHIPYFETVESRSSSVFLFLMTHNARQFLWDGGLPCAGDDSPLSVWGVGGFLAVWMLRLRAVRGAISVLVATQAKKIHPGKHP